MKPEEKQMVEDLVTAAFNDARDRARQVVDASSPDLSDAERADVASASVLYSISS